MMMPCRPAVAIIPDQLPDLMLSYHHILSHNCTYHEMPTMSFSYLCICDDIPSSSSAWENSSISQQPVLPGIVSNNQRISLFHTL